MKTVKLNPSPATFPLTELIEAGLWAALSPAAWAVFAVLWDFHRQFPDTCHPSRATLSAKAGISEPTATRAIKELESVGLVQVLPAPGPGPNTYRIQWHDLSIPEKRRGRTRGASPYARPASEHDTYLNTDEQGRNKVVRERVIHSHKMPDGCVVRSASEVTLHAFLVDWKIPHFCNVPYHALGIRGLHHESTVDFVVGPRLVVEHFGLPRIQDQVSRYNRKRRLKEDAIKRAGWTLIAVEAGKLITPDQVNLVFDRWAESTIEDAERLRSQITTARMWHPGYRSRNGLKGHILDAIGRRDGEREPRTLVYPTNINGATGESNRNSCLVLGTQYNETAMKEDQTPKVETPSGQSSPVVSKVPDTKPPRKGSDSEPELPFRLDMKRPRDLEEWGDDDDEEDDFED